MSFSRSWHPQHAQHFIVKNICDMTPNSPPRPSLITKWHPNSFSFFFFYKTRRARRARHPAHRHPAPAPLRTSSRPCGLIYLIIRSSAWSSFLSVPCQRAVELGLVPWRMLSRFCLSFFPHCRQRNGVDENKHAKKEKYLKKFNNNNERFKKTKLTPSPSRRFYIIDIFCQSLWCKVQVSHESRQSRPKSPAQKLQPLRRHHICTLGSIDK